MAQQILQYNLNKYHKSSLIIFINVMEGKGERTTFKLSLFNENNAKTGANLIYDLMTITGARSSNIIVITLYLA